MSEICPLFLAGLMANSTYVEERQAQETSQILESLVKCKKEGCQLWWFCSGQVINVSF